MKFFPNQQNYKLLCTYFEPLHNIVIQPLPESFSPNIHCLLSLQEDKCLNSTEQKNFIINRNTVKQNEKTALCQMQNYKSPTQAINKTKV